MLLPESNHESPVQSESESNHESPIQSELETSVDHSAEHDSRELADTDRALVQVGHRVQLLNEEGKPMPKQLIYFASWDEEGMRPFRENTAVVHWPWPGAERFQTNAQGIAVIPTLQAGVASFTDFGRTAYVYCESRVSSSARTQLHELQLRELPMVEVVVLDREGNVAQDGFRFEAKTALQASAEALPSNASARERAAVWLKDDTIALLPGGKRVLALEACNLARPSFPQGETAWVQELSFLADGGQTEARIVNGDTPGPIVFRMPKAGRLSLELENAPLGIVPVLFAMVGPNKQVNLHPQARATDSGTSWDFVRVPIDVPLRVGYSVSFAADGQSAPIPTKLLGPDIPALTVDGEHARATVRFAWSSGFSGKLKPPNSLLRRQAEFFSACMNHGLSSRIVFDAGVAARVVARCIVLPDGTFLVPAKEGAQGSRKAQNIRGFSLLWDAARLDEASRSNEATVDFAWAFVDARLPNYSSTIDVGIVQLESSQPLLVVQVEGADGQPVQGAAIQLEYQCERFQEHFGRAEFREGWADELRTNATGEAWVIARDWYEYFGILHPEAEGAYLGDFSALRLSASHPMLEKRVEEFDRGRRTIRLRLNRAGTLGGSVLGHPAIQSCRVGLIPPGAQFGEEHPEGTQLTVVNMYSTEVGEPAEFELNSVPEGSYDFVLQVSRYAQTELLRIPGVTVKSGAPALDPRLQNIDLAPLLPCLYLTLLDETGQAFSAKQLAEAEFRLQVPTSADDWVTRPARMDQARIVLAVPKQLETLAEPILHSSIYSSKAIGPWSAGAREIQVHEAQLSSLELNNFSSLPEGSGLTLRFVPDDLLQRQFRLLRIEKPNVEVRWPTAGKYSIQWRLVASNHEWRVSAESEFSLSQSDFEAGATVQLSVPRALLQQIPK